MAEGIVLTAGQGAILIILVLASGLTAAGLLSAMHRIVWPDEEGDDGRLVLHFDTPGAILWSIIICCFAGPWLLVSKGLHFWRRDILPPAGAALCVVLALLWSFCSGIVVIEMLGLAARLAG